MCVCAKAASVLSSLSIGKSLFSFHSIIYILKAILVTWLLSSRLSWAMNFSFPCIQVKKWDRQHFKYLNLHLHSSVKCTSYAWRLNLVSLSLSLSTPSLSMNRLPHLYMYIHASCACLSISLHRDSFFSWRWSILSSRCSSIHVQACHCSWQ